MLTLLIFLAVLAVLVLSHEFGHFIVARKNGMKVEEFGFGFPPRLCGIRRVGEGVNKHWQVVWGNKEVKALEAESNLPGGTIYSFNWLPLGGFVKIKGEDGENKDADSFGSKKAWQKAAVLVAGVGMNMVVAYVFIVIGYVVGLPQTLEGMNDVSRVPDRHIEVLQVIPGKPAQAAGVAVGDKIIALGSFERPRLDELRAYVDQHRDEEISVTIERNKETIIKKIHPAIYSETGKGGLGVGIIEVGTVRYPLSNALYQGVITTGTYLKGIVFGFGFIIKSLFTGGDAARMVSGPVGVAVMTGQVARLGFVHLLQFMAILSLNLAVLNILPIPALDGGRLLFVILTKLLRRTTASKYEQVIHTVGFVFLMVLVVAVTVKDLGAFKGVFVDFVHKVF